MNEAERLAADFNSMDVQAFANGRDAVDVTLTVEQAAWLATVVASDRADASGLWGVAYDPQVEAEYRWDTREEARGER